MQSQYQKGMIAGLAATVTVVVVDLAASLVQNMMGLTVGERWFHTYSAIQSAMARQVIGLEGAWVGWAIQIAAGILFLGPLFAVLCPRLPTDTPATKGIVFAVAAWLVMCLTVMPLAGLGLFGAAGGFGSVAWMLVIHMIFGVMLGRVYDRLHGDVGHARRTSFMPAQQ